MRVRYAASLLASVLLAGCAGHAVPGPTASAQGADWPRYSRDEAGTRFSPLTQITTANVSQLDQAWSFTLRPDGGAGLLGGSAPIVVDGVMYLPLGNAVVALEADSGRELWRHAVEGGLVRRGVSWWPGEGALGPRIFYSTGAALHALDPRTGEKVAAFGTGGSTVIDGTPYGSPPSVYGNVLVIGANTGETPRGAAGNTRAFDARTGAKLWEFNSVPHPGEVGHETWQGDSWDGRSGTNMWVWYTTGDVATNTVYVTLGSPSPNYYGGDRPGDNLFGNSVVALDMQTGAYKWHFQTVHHDLWDYDLPAPPVLVDITANGRSIPALALTGKPGLMYILDRNTGEPVHGVNEMVAAPGDVPGEYYSPTQPIPVRPAALNRMWWDPADVVTAEDTTPEHAAACQELLASYGGRFFNAGPFTPFFLHEEGEEPRASINLPHNGGSNWGGSAADPARGVVYVNTSESAAIGWVEPRVSGGNYGRGAGATDQPYDRGSLTGPGAYSSFSASATAPDGTRANMPCIRPPWGQLHAVDAGSGEILWSSTLGLSENLPEGRQETGANNTFGGPIVTAGGLVFIGGTNDAHFRAFDAANGALLWSKKLPFAPLSVPITYQGRDGRQYVAVFATGAVAGAPANQESLISFALPQ